MSNKIFKIYILFLCLNICCSGKKVTIAYRNKIINLGHIESDKIYQDSILVKSVGNGVLEIKQIISDCTCTVVATESVSIYPGDSAFIDYNFTSPIIGNFRHTITIKNNSANEPDVMFTIEGSVMDKELLKD